MKKAILILCAILFSQLTLADAFEENEIDPNLPLPELVEAVGTYINDGNITTGTSVLGFESEEKISNLQKFAAKLLIKETKPDQNTSLSEINTENIDVPSAFIDIAWDLGVGNAYDVQDCSLKEAKENLSLSDCENLKEFAEFMEVIVKKVGPAADLSIARATGEVTNYGTTRKTMLYAIANPKTQNVVWVYIVEGTM